MVVQLYSDSQQAINYSSYDFYKQQLARFATTHHTEERLGRFVAGALAGEMSIGRCTVRLEAGGFKVSSGCRRSHCLQHSPLPQALLPHHSWQA